MPYRPRHQRLGRNDPCPCGSGKKFKNCCALKPLLLKTTAPDRPPKTAQEKFIEAIHHRAISNTAVVWVAKDIHGAKLSWPDAIAALSSMNVESALLSIALINAVCAELARIRHLNTKNGANKVAALCDYLFPERLRPVAFSNYVENAHQLFIALAPQACMAMTEACLRFCSKKEGSRFMQPHECEGFSHVLLSFQQSLAESKPGEKISFHALTDEQFRMFTRNFQAANLERDLSRLMVRHYIMFEVAANNGVLLERAHVSGSQWFTTVTGGVTPVAYRALMLFALSHGHKFSIEEPNLSDLVYNLDQMLAKVKPETASAYRRLHELAVVTSQSLETSEIADWDHAIYGLHYLRRKPILALGGPLYVCLFKHLIQERFFLSTVHVLTELVDTFVPAGWSAEAKSRRTKVRIEYGYLFEDYVRFLLGLYFPAPHAFTTFPFVRPSGNEHDGLILCGQTALVFEFVHHPWSLAERTAGDAASFVRHMKDNVEKAAALAGHLESVLHFSTDGSPIVQILPIVICAEAVPITEFTAETWQSALIAATSRDAVLGHGRIRPIQLLSLTQLENIDNLTGLDSPPKVAGFLAQRSADLLLRFDAAGNLRAAMSAQPMRLALFEEEAEASLKKHGPALFVAE